MPTPSAAGTARIAPPYGPRGAVPRGAAGIRTERLRRLCRRSAAESLELRVDEQADELRERQRWLPAEAGPCALRRADEVVQLRPAADERLVDAHVLVPVEVEVGERALDELLHRVRLAGGDHVVVRLVLLEDQPHRPHVVARE